MKNLADVIIQARMGSTRLPGKVLRSVLGKSLLEYMIERVRAAQTVRQIIVATTQNSEDDAIENICHKLKITCTRGSSSDVLERYYQAAMQLKLNPIVRLTADCPLIDPQVIDRVVTHYFKLFPKIDYVSNDRPDTFPKGMDVEIMSYKVLERAHLEAKTPEQREHVTPYLRENPDLFQCESLVHSEDWSRYRCTVDYPEDFEQVRKMIETLYPANPLFLMKDVVAFLKHHEKK